MIDEENKFDWHIYMPSVAAEAVIDQTLQLAEQMPRTLHERKIGKNVPPSLSQTHPLLSWFDR